MTDLELVRRPDFTADLHVWGCSFAWGTGLEEEKTWPYILSKQLKMTLANWAIEGASPPRVWGCYQTLRPELNPKLSIIAWPTLNRDWVQGRNMGHWNRHLDPNFNRRLISGELQRSNLELIQRAKTQIQEPVIHFSLAKLWPYLRFPDLVKDGLHPGPRTHELVADYVLSRIG